MCVYDKLSRTGRLPWARLDVFVAVMCDKPNSPAVFVFFDVWPRLLCCLIIVATCIGETYRSVGLLLVGIQSRWGKSARPVS